MEKVFIVILSVWGIGAFASFWIFLIMYDDVPKAVVRGIVWPLVLIKSAWNELKE